MKLLYKNNKNVKKYHSHKFTTIRKSFQTFANIVNLKVFSYYKYKDGIW